MVNRSIAPDIQIIDNITLSDIQNITMPNGFKLYYLHSLESEVISLKFIFNAGLIHQQKKLVASTVANLLTSGTLHKTNLEISEALEYQGVFYGAEASSAISNVHFRVLKKNLLQILPIIEDIIKHANFPQSEIDLYIKNHVEHYATQVKNVATVCGWNFSKLLFGDQHPMNSFRTPEDYKNITRDDLLNFYTQHYHPKNGFILLSGNIDESILNQITKYFGEKGFHQSQTVFTNDIPPALSYNEHSYTTMPNAVQSAVKIGCILPIYRNHPDYFGLMIANTVLGGYFGSRLMSVIREEKGYTYGIGSGIAAFKHYAYFVVSCEVKAAHTQDTIDEVINQIEILQNNPPDEDELMIVKNYMTGELLEMTDGIFKQESMHQSMLINKLDKDYYSRYLTEIKNITPKKISDVLKKYIDTKNLKKCIVGQIQ